MNSRFTDTMATPESGAQTLNLQHAWLPFTPNRDFHLSPKVLASARGVYYYDPSGRPILDGSSGLFSVAAGHAREEIAEAVSRQLGELDFAPSFYRGHPLLFRAAEKLAGILPASLDKVFFTNSGSEAVETAMKMALSYHRARGEGHRTIFVSRERAYHGVSFGGLSLSGMVNNRRQFGSQLPNTPLLRHTLLAENRFSQGLPEHGAELADDLLRIIAAYGAENIAAVFVEPVAGSTGVLPPPAGYLKRLRDITRQHGILLVFDEVITGFGRTGAAFASQTFDVTPDILTMAKAINNGAIPMGAVAVSQSLYQNIIEQAPQQQIEFFHGYTTGGHPVALAASIATLEIYQRDALFERAQALSDYFSAKMHGLRDLPVIADIRVIGLLAGIELHSDSIPGARGYQVQKDLFDAGLHIKTTGDTAIIAPAFISTESQIDELTHLLRAVLSELTFSSTK